MDTSQAEGAEWLEEWKGGWIYEGGEGEERKARRVGETHPSEVSGELIPGERFRVFGV